MRLIVVISEPTAVDQLRDAVSDGAAPEDVEVMVVAPALQESALQFWLSDADDSWFSNIRRRSAATERESIPLRCRSGSPLDPITAGILTARSPDAARCRVRARRSPRGR